MPDATKHDREQALAEQAAFARRVIEAEAAAVSRIKIDDAFHRAVELILTHTSEPRRGRVVVGGIGKSGIIGRKVSATLSSTGTRSLFLHPTEAMHGDLGQLGADDVVLLLSFGGATEEVVALATLLKQDAAPVVAIVGKPNCHLAELAAEALCIGDVTEACPMNLAPSASTTAMLAMGDALALCVSRRRNFGVDDFRKVHPGGALGRQLMPVTSAMRWQVGRNLVVCGAAMSLREAFAAVDQTSQRRPGALLVADDAGRLAGIFTDGDLRRLYEHAAMDRTLGDLMAQPLGDVMTANPRRLTTDALVRDAVQMVRELRVDELPVVDEAGQPVGLVDVQDLIALRVIEET